MNDFGEIQRDMYILTLSCIFVGHLHGLDIHGLDIHGLDTKCQITNHLTIFFQYFNNGKM